MALYDQEVARNKGTPNYQPLKTAVKLHVVQVMRNRNFKARNDVVERGSVTKSHKEEKPALRGKWESAFSGKYMDNVPKETHVVSVMTLLPLETVAKVRDEKDDRFLLHPIRRQNRLTARVKNPRKDQAVNRKTHLISENPCRFIFFF